MSESFQTALAKVNYGKYIDEIQAELRRATQEVAASKNPKDVEAIQGRVQALMRKQSAQLAKEVGFAGNQLVVFMMATSILSIAWVSFALRREASDLSKSPEDRLGTIEMLDALDLALGKVIDSASSYADRYSPVAADAIVSSEGGEEKEE